MAASWTPEQNLKSALQSLRHIWRRWNAEADQVERERLWALVQEAEYRVYLNKRDLGLIVPGVCPKCSNTPLLKVPEHLGTDYEICKRCGWSRQDDFLEIVRDLVSRLKSKKSLKDDYDQDGRE